MDTGMEQGLEASEMTAFIQKSGASESGTCEQEDSEEGSCALSMWLHEEELVDEASWHRISKGPQQQQQQPRRQWQLRACMGIAVLLSSAAAMRNFLQKGTNLLKGDPKRVFIV